MMQPSRCSARAEACLEGDGIGDAVIWRAARWSRSLNGVRAPAKPRALVLRGLPLYSGGAILFLHRTKLAAEEMTAMGVGRLDHFNIRTDRLDDTVRFYRDVLGLTEGERPNFSFPGAWLYSEGRPVVHLVDISASSEPQKPDSGVVHHVAFASRDFAGMTRRLQQQAVEFDTRQVPGGAVWQIFVRDPNGVLLELNYEAAAEQG